MATRFPSNTPALPQFTDVPASRVFDSVGVLQLERCVESIQMKGAAWQRVAIVQMRHEQNRAAPYVMRNLAVLFEERLYLVRCDRYCRVTCTHVEVDRTLLERMVS